VAKSFTKVSRIATGAALAALGVVSFASAASATTGSASITTPGGGALAGYQSSTTLYNITPPTGATCSGTGAAGFLINTYLVAQGVAPPGLSGGIPASGDTLYDTLGNNIYAVAPGSVPVGGVGGAVEAGQLPASYDIHFNKAAFGTLSTTPSTFEAGLDCTNGSGTVTDYWNVELLVKSVPADAYGFQWEINNPGTSLPETPLTVGLPLGGAAVLGGAYFITRRRSARQQLNTTV